MPGCSPLGALILVSPRASTLVTGRPSLRLWTTSPSPPLGLSCHRVSSAGTTVVVHAQITYFVSKRSFEPDQRFLFTSADGYDHGAAPPSSGVLSTSRKSPGAIYLLTMVRARHVTARFGPISNTKTESELAVTLAVLRHLSICYRTGPKRTRMGTRNSSMSPTQVRV